MVIPLRDRLPTHRTAWVNHAIIIVNIAVFAFIQPWSAGVCEQQEFFVRYAAIPAELTQGEPLDTREVAMTTHPRCAITPAPDKPVYLAVLVAMFLHGGWLHLLGNMLFLWIFGDNVEDRLGHVRYLAFYALTGVIATAAFVLPTPGSPATLVGASGAIAGVLGAYIVMYPRSRITVIVMPLWFLPLALPAVVVLGLWFVFQLLEAGNDPFAGGGVAYLAHVGGFVAGFLIARRVRPPSRTQVVRR